jgi:hypothetical protein
MSEGLTELKNRRAELVKEQQRLTAAFDRLRGAKDRQNRADNRLANLRHATRSQNNANSRLRSNNTSGFKGICLDRSRRGSAPWQAYINVNGKRRSLAYHITPEEAHAAYAKAAKETFGKYARFA